MRQPAIMIADDDPGLVKLLKSTLLPLGFAVTVTSEPIPALSRLYLNPHDLVIMDVNMPGGNGLNACQMLADNPGLASIPVIVLTGSSDPRIRHRCQELGAHYVRKGPAAIDQVRELACRLLSTEVAAVVESGSLYFG